MKESATVANPVGSTLVGPTDPLSRCKNLIEKMRSEIEHEDDENYWITKLGLSRPIVEDRDNTEKERERRELSSAFRENREGATTESELFHEDGWTPSFSVAGKETKEDTTSGSKETDFEDTVSHPSLKINKQAVLKTNGRQNFEADVLEPTAAKGLLIARVSKSPIAHNQPTETSARPDPMIFPTQGRDTIARPDPLIAAPSDDITSMATSSGVPPAQYELDEMSDVPTTHKKGKIVKSLVKALKKRLSVRKQDRSLSPIRFPDDEEQQGSPPENDANQATIASINSTIPVSLASSSPKEDRNEDNVKAELEKPEPSRDSTPQIIINNNNKTSNNPNVKSNVPKTIDNTSHATKRGKKENGLEEMNAKLVAEKSNGETSNSTYASHGASSKTRTEGNLEEKSKKLTIESVQKGTETKKNNAIYAHRGAITKTLDKIVKAEDTAGSKPTLEDVLTDLPSIGKSTDNSEDDDFGLATLEENSKMILQQFESLKSVFHRSRAQSSELLQNVFNTSWPTNSSPTDASSPPSELAPVEQPSKEDGDVHVTSQEQKEVKTAATEEQGKDTTAGLLEDPSEGLKTTEVLEAVIPIGQASGPSEDQPQGTMMSEVLQAVPAPTGESRGQSDDQDEETKTVERLQADSTPRTEVTGPSEDQSQRAKAADGQAASPPSAPFSLVSIFERKRHERDEAEDQNDGLHPETENPEADKSEQAKPSEEKIEKKQSAPVKTTKSPQKEESKEKGQAETKEKEPTKSETEEESETEPVETEKEQAQMETKKIQGSSGTKAEHKNVVGKTIREIAKSLKGGDKTRKKEAKKKENTGNDNKADVAERQSNKKDKNIQKKEAKKKENTSNDNKTDVAEQQSNKKDKNMHTESPEDEQKKMEEEKLSSIEATSLENENDDKPTSSRKPRLPAFKSKRQKRESTKPKDKQATEDEPLEETPKPQLEAEETSKQPQATVNKGKDPQELWEIEIKAKNNHRKKVKNLWEAEIKAKNANNNVKNDMENDTKVEKAAKKERKEKRRKEKLERKNKKGGKGHVDSIKVEKDHLDPVKETPHVQPEPVPVFVSDEREGTKKMLSWSEEVQETKKQDNENAEMEAVIWWSQSRDAVEVFYEEEEEEQEEEKSSSESYQHSSSGTTTSYASYPTYTEDDQTFLSELEPQIDFSFSTLKEVTETIVEEAALIREEVADASKDMLRKTASNLTDSGGALQRWFTGGSSTKEKKREKKEKKEKQKQKQKKQKKDKREKEKEKKKEKKEEKKKKKRKGRQ